MKRVGLVLGVFLLWGHLTPLWGQTLIHAEKVEIKPPVADRGASSLKVWGGVQFGTSANVGTINSDGKVPEISTTYFASLSGANLTGITFAGWASNSCTTDQIPKWNGSAWACATDQTASGEGEGSVTSVDLSMPSAEFGISGTPITTSGTIAVTWDTQTANYVFAGPSSGSAAVPTFRQLVAADLTPAGAALTGGDNTWTGNNFFTGTWTRVGTTSTTAIYGNVRFDVQYSGGSTYVGAVSYGGVPAFAGFASGGTSGSPSGVTSGSTIGWYVGWGRHSTGWPSYSSGAFGVVASEDFTATARGTRLGFHVTAIGSTSREEKMRLDDQGRLGINTTSPSETLDVNGNVEITGYMANSVIPKTNDTYNLGDPSKLWSQIFASQINAIIYAESTAQLFGGYSIIGKTVGSTASRMTATDTQVDLGVAITPLPQWMLIRAHDESGTVKAEYMQITSLASGTTYNVTRDLAGWHGTDPVWPSGTAWLLLGVQGDGRIEMYSYTGVPRIGVFTQGATYAASTEVMRVGGLDGMPGMSGLPGKYGIYVGDNTGSQYLVYYDGNLSIGGTITAAAGAIGGWVIGATTLSASSGTVGMSSAVTGGDDIRFWAGNATMASAPFRVTEAGVLTATSGTVGGWTLGATALTAGSGSTTVGLDAGGSNPALYAGSATPGSAPFRVSTAGALTATSGSVGGWTLAAETLTASSATVGLSSTVTGGDDIRFWAGHATPASAPFRVTEAGVVTATSGTVGGWTLGATALTAGSGSTTVGLDAGGSNPAIYAGSATPGSAPFRVTSAGAVTATSGTVGGWTLSATALTAGSGSTTVGVDAGGSNPAFYAGSATPGSAPFRVTAAGALTATSGSVGGWTLGATALTAGSGSTTVGLDAGGSNPAFYAGSATPGSAPFRVTASGALTATNATITGAITATSGSFTGTVTATSGSFTGTINATAGWFGSDVNDVAIDSSGLSVGNAGSLRGGATAYDSGDGFFLGYSSGYKFRIGEADGCPGVRWTGSDLEVCGDGYTLTDANGLYFSNASDESDTPRLIRWAQGTVIGASSTNSRSWWRSASDGTYSQINLYPDYLLMWGNTSGGGNNVFLDQNEFSPDVGDTLDLGSDTYPWTEVWVATAVVPDTSAATLGTASKRWGAIFVDPPSTTSEDYPIVYSSGNNQLYYKTDGVDNSAPCSGGGVADISVERGIVTGVSCSPPGQQGLLARVVALEAELARLYALLGERR
jgi:hypothetical protein